MPIKITLPRAKQTVVLHDFDSLEDMLFSSREEYLEKPATSLLMFRRIIAYAELLGKQVFDEEEVYDHLKQSMAIYNSITEYDSPEPTEIENYIEERIKEESFNKVYSPVVEEVISEIFKLFASGVLASYNGFTEVLSSDVIDSPGVIDA